MQVKNNLYPYPLLASFKDDYVDSQFDVNYSVKNEFTKFVLKVEFSLTEGYIQSLIDSGDLTYLVHVECPITAYRKAFTTKESTLTIPINGNEVRNTIQVASFITANSNVKNFASPNFNSLYEGYSFDFKKGEIIAASNHQNIEIVSEYIDYQSVPSIITVVSAKLKIMDVVTDGSKIVIRLPEKIFNMYNTLAKTQYQSTIISAIILPALVEVLNEISYLGEEREFYEENRPWFQVIKKVLEKSGYSIDDIGEKYSALVFAQMILQNPVNKGLEEITSEIEREETDEA
ncbi:hypothetical protein [Jeotgalibaca dankookensis]|uniref:hypothetical protein n=1 Tax=Jeotgalibaca dankookensis TaxID=708126 RepID=UPI000782B98A|nr:hypothetical protein [Jeotgalibaca dankookensis]